MYTNRPLRFRGVYAHEFITLFTFLWMLYYALRYSDLKTRILFGPFDFHLSFLVIAIAYIIFFSIATLFTVLGFIRGNHMRERRVIMAISAGIFFYIGTRLWLFHPFTSFYSGVFFAMGVYNIFVSSRLYNTPQKY